MVECDETPLTDQQIAKLKTDIERYWKKWSSQSANADVLLREYVQEYLQREMKIARARGRLPARSFDTLAMLVGYSIEPLLQTIVAYQPRRVALLLNSEYVALTKGDNGKRQKLTHDEFGDLVQKAIWFLAEQDWVYDDARKLQEVKKVLVQQATPLHVFDTLRQELRAVTNPLIDITGAKKSMVAGAFLYAAFADVPVTYVDFDDKEFDPQVGRPYGFACRIGLLSNPYTDFALRDWENVREQYRLYNFRGARKLLKGIRAALEVKQTLFPAELFAAIERLDAILLVYQFWEEGALADAHSQAQAVAKTLSSFVAPLAVSTLGARIGPTNELQELKDEFHRLQFGARSGEQANPSESIWLQPNLFLPYVRDEYKRITRLIDLHEDYRSALLRAASLSEVLLKARLVVAWKKGALSGRSRDAALFDELAGYGNRPGHRGVPTMLGTLIGTRDLPLQVASVRLDTGQLKMENFWQDSLDPDTLRELRNNAIHFGLFVSQPLAQKAGASVSANLSEYLKSWASQLDVSAQQSDADYQELPWDKLCALCGLDQLLAPNLVS